MQRYTVLSFDFLNSQLRRTETEVELPLLGKLEKEDYFSQLEHQMECLGDPCYTPWRLLPSRLDTFRVKLEGYLPLISNQSRLLLVWNFVLVLTILYNFI